MNEEDPNWIDFLEMLEIAGVDAPRALAIQQGKLPPSTKRVKVWNGLDYEWQLRWWRPSVELNVSQWRIAGAM